MEKVFVWSRSRTIVNTIHVLNTYFIGRTFQSFEIDKHLKNIVSNTSLKRLSTQHLIERIDKLHYYMPERIILKHKSYTRNMEKTTCSISDTNLAESKPKTETQISIDQLLTTIQKIKNENDFLRELTRDTHKHSNLVQFLQEENGRLKKTITELNEDLDSQIRIVQEYQNGKHDSALRQDNTLTDLHRVIAGLKRQLDQKDETISKLKSQLTEYISLLDVQTQPMS